VFANAEFQSDVRFGGAYWDGDGDGELDVWERGCSFGGAVDFEGTDFGGSVEFYDAEFASTVNMSGTHFRSEAVFRGAKFHAVVAFEGATFLGKAWFDSDPRYGLAETAFVSVPRGTAILEGDGQFVFSVDCVCYLKEGVERGETAVGCENENGKWPKLAGAGGE
jgi:hypothetical protein